MIVWMVLQRFLPELISFMAIQAKHVVYMLFRFVSENTIATEFAIVRDSLQAEGFVFCRALQGVFDLVEWFGPYISL